MAVNKDKRIAIIGGGAAGCFCAVQLAELLGSGENITVYEAGPRPMAKLALTGGGRCNFTNSFALIDNLRDAYPRGEQLMKRVLRVFSPQDCRAWFKSHGVPSVVQDDQCVFPASQDAMQVVRMLERCMRESSVKMLCGSRIENVMDIEADIRIVTTGGAALKLLESLDLQIEPPVPSLFTFKIPDESLRSLMGITVDNAALSIPGTPFRSQGILLVTDWGISGPATLKLSSYAARFLAEKQYCCPLLVNWTGTSENETLEMLTEIAGNNPQKQVSSVRPELPGGGILSERLWKHLIGRAALRQDIRWAEMGGKGLRRLASVLCADAYDIRGRAKFKEEFVTCGGVSLKEINLQTLEARKYPGLYFAGEVLDIDAVTGGFNLQAAWSTATVVADTVAGVVAKSVASALK